MPALDAPAGPLAPATDLVLTGANLTAVDRVFLWPDRGLQAPAEVIERAPDALAARQITLARAGLDADGLRAIRYRAAARFGPNRYTQFVIVEVER